MTWTQSPRNPRFLINEDEECVALIDGRRTEEEARLIAAAPELLEALKKVVALEADPVAEFTLDDMMGDLKTLIKRIES